MLRMGKIRITCLHTVKGEGVDMCKADILSFWAVVDTVLEGANTGYLLL